MRIRLRLRRKPEAETGELNIVPYLDIMVNLIMFLLISQTVLLGRIEVKAPGIRGPTVVEPDPAPPQDGLKLTLGIARGGFFLAAKGGVLPGDTRDAPSIPTKADGSYDYDRLAHTLRAIKDSFPDNRAVYLVADASIPYEVVVHTLDAAREDARGELLPEVGFAQLN